MSANTFGELFRVTTFGESHGGGVGCVIDGCPPLLNLSENDFATDLKRRETGQSHLTSQRKEEDKVEIMSGLFEGKTLGTPIALLVKNTDANPAHYEYLQDKYRPSHADYTYDAKYGIRAWAGGGRASARETTARVMAGTIAKKILKEQLGIEILAFVSKVKELNCDLDPNSVTYEQVEANIVRCPDPTVAEKMIKLIEQIKGQGDSVGGVITCVAKNVPAGLGEPVFDKLTADLAKAMMSIPATRGFEVGSGFAATEMTGITHNDPFYIKPDGKIATKTNNSGGIQGGISNGENIITRTAFKPVSTIIQPQQTVNDKGEEIEIKNIKGRHDPCVLPRAVVIVEAMTALVLVDHYLRQKAISRR
ncbi:MAG: chorismate synthase [bacterium]